MSALDDCRKLAVSPASWREKLVGWTVAGSLLIFTMSFLAVVAVGMLILTPVALGTIVVCLLGGRAASRFQRARQRQSSARVWQEVPRPTTSDMAPKTNSSNAVN